MTSIPGLHRLIRPLAPALMVLLMVGWYAGGAHHHAVGPVHPCAACTLGHSIAVPTDVAAPAVAPDEPERALHAPATSPVCSARLATAPCRAPPRT